jgi:ubiquitin-like protein Pup
LLWRKLRRSVDLASPEERSRRLSDGVDKIVDEIDEIWGGDAEEFVRSYVQKGAQGWSTFVHPSFFVCAATAGIVASATYDAFKNVMATIVHAISKVPGPMEARVYEPDGS